MIIASMVLRNEADRYLASCLEWNSQWWDKLFVYDDQSTDATREICSEYTDIVISRPDDVPSFMEDEGRYRSTAWATMIDACDLSEGDWVFSLDADEFLVGALSGGEHDLKQGLLAAAEICESEGHNSWNIRIPEVWDVTDNLKLRVDGFWNTMALPRFTRVKSEWEFRNKKMGCGSTPTYSYRNMFKGEFMKLLHFGYARIQDRQARSDRYLSLVNHGHNPKHINSILSSPTYVDWIGQVPDARYG